ncbi:MAG: SDR family oxidoreductase [Alphaproteobacteria bacterium]
MSDRTLLVVGATGLLGRAALLHFRALPGWDVIGLSRREHGVEGVRHIPADLTDPGCLSGHVSALRPVTHVLYAALYEMEDLVGGWRHEQQMAVNDAMFRTLLGAVQDAAPDLEHVHLLQGTKAYGIHVEPMRAPAKERWPRHPHENFYWLQEDHLRAEQAGKAWRYTIWRPQAVFGYALGSPMNLVGAIGAYASICREMGAPCRYPGGVPIASEATDSRLLARAVAWAADNAAANDQTFNITNGDVLIWPNLWPTVCDYFGVEPGEPEPQILADTMPAMEDVWAGMVARHDLRPHTLAELVGGSWQFLDRAMRAGAEAAPPSLVSTIKLRQAGFGDCLDTEDSLRYWFSEMQANRLLPP